MDVTAHRYWAPLKNSVNNGDMIYGIAGGNIPLVGRSTRLGEFLEPTQGVSELKRKPAHKLSLALHR